MVPNSLSSLYIRVRRCLILAALTLFLTPALSACKPNQDEMTKSFSEFLGYMELLEPVSRTETGEDGYLYRLENGVLSVSDGNGTELWHSEESWWVDDFRLGDVDGDGVEDFLYTLWKSFRFGDVKPSRMENDDETVRNHLFLYTVLSGHVKSIWGSSDLPRPIYSFELDASGPVTPVSSGMLLLTEEGEYRDDFSLTESVMYKYVWEGWGFVPISVPSPEPTPEPIAPMPEPTCAPSGPIIPVSDGEIDTLLASVFTYEGLLDLAELDAGFFFDIRYATEDNFTGLMLYDRPLCLMHTDAARMLLLAQALADELGYRLLIYDAYRPEPVQQVMYDITPAKSKNFVAKPGKNANHTKGVAVDCSLADMEGNPIDMPSGYDEFTSRAAVAYAGGTEEQRANRDMLIKIMAEAGMKPASGEWWHFTPVDMSGYAPLTVSFEEFETARAEK